MLKKKSLGQHFLRSHHYLSLIADTAEIVRGESVLEVGPGDGALTRELAARGALIVAVEKDRRLISLLQEKFAGKNFTLIEGDILELEISKYIKDRKYKVVANIPYYITGALLKKFLSAKKQPSSMTLLVQKEVAERIARSKKESILSLSVKAYGTPQYVATVPKGTFSPPPGVDSAVLHVADISRKRFKNAAHEKKFFELVRAGFAQKRKLLSRNLSQLLGSNHSDILKNVGVSEKARAEDVPLEKWLALAYFK